MHLQDTILLERSSTSQCKRSCYLNTAGAGTLQGLSVGANNSTTDASLAVSLERTERACTCSTSINHCQLCELLMLFLCFAGFIVSCVGG